MPSSSTQQYKKAQKQIQQILKAKFLKAFNVIELMYKNDGSRGCKRKDHELKFFHKLFILPCTRTSNCEYFSKKINNPINVGFVEVPRPWSLFSIIV